MHSTCWVALKKSKSISVHFTNTKDRLSVHISTLIDLIIIKHESTTKILAVLKAFKQKVDMILYDGNAFCNTSKVIENKKVYCSSEKYQFTNSVKVLITALITFLCVIVQATSMDSFKSSRYFEIIPLF